MNENLSTSLLNIKYGEHIRFNITDYTMNIIGSADAFRCDEVFHCSSAGAHCQVFSNLCCLLKRHMAILCELYPRLTET